MKEFFDGASWARDAVVAAQKQRSAQVLALLGLQVKEAHLLSEPVPESRVSDFERIHGCNLPYEYRSFLLQVGEGGRGPGREFRMLGTPYEDYESWEPGTFFGGRHEPNLRLDHPFPYIDAVPVDEEFVADLHANPEKYIVDAADAGPFGIEGALYLFNRGGVVWDFLVMNGPCRGQVWADRANDDGPTYPIQLDGTRVGFAQYYCAWLNGEVS